MSVVVLCTCPDGTVAAELASALVAAGLAACVNRLPVQSTYRWKGEVCCDDEILLLIKTTRKQYPALEAAILAQHPYELPEIIALPIEAGHAPYLAWLAAQTGPTQ